MPKTAHEAGWEAVSTTLVASVAVLAASGAAALFLVPRGYGGDNDTYVMLATWQDMIVNGRYTPSRYQGSIVGELANGYLAGFFGPWGTNLAALALVVITILVIDRLALRHLEAAHRLPALALIASNPFVILAATTAMDYAYALCGLALGLWLFACRKPWAAAVLMALAVGARLQFGPLALLAFAFWLIGETSSRRETLQALALFVFTCGLLYLPAFISHHLTFSFLGVAEAADRGLLDHVVRFAYKTSLLTGHAGTVVILAIVVGYIVVVLRGRADTAPWRQGPVLLAAGITTASLVTFLRFPLSISYLLPVVFALSVLLALLKAPPAAVTLVAILQVGYWFVSPDILEITYAEPGGPGTPIVATGARAAPNLKPGVLRADLERRDEYQAYYLENYLLAEPRTFWRNRDSLSPHRHELIGVRSRFPPRREASDSLD